MRTWNWLTLALAVVVASGCGSGSTSGSSTSGSPIVIGYEAPLTGAFAALGQAEKKGFDLGLKTFGTSVNGHPIQVKYVDTHGDPTTALSGARQLVELDHISILEGPLVGPEISAVSPYVGAKGIPTDDLGACSYPQYLDYLKYGVGFSSDWQCDQPAIMGAQWAFQDMHWSHITIIGFDFSVGWITSGAWATAFRHAGGTIDKVIWVPGNAVDLSPYVPQIPTSTNAVFAVLSGQIGINFIKAYKQFGLAGKIPLLGITQLTDQSVLPAEDVSAATGTYSDAQYCDGIDSQANNAFVSAYKAEYGTIPGYVDEAGYVKARLAINALKQVHGDVSNLKQLIKVMKTTPIVAPRGPVALNTETNSPIQNVYICRVQSVNGELRNVPIKTFTHVQPWGTLGKADWLAHYSHDSSARPS
jgi:branched-chain amino acid transport system substrate-binding protein